MQLIIPKGYKRIMWEDVKPGLKVWVCVSGIAKGPHRIYNAEDRMLINKKKNVYQEQDEILLVEGEEPAVVAPTVGIIKKKLTRTLVKL